MEDEVERSAVERDGMRIAWDVAIEADDGLELRADVFLPAAPGRYPVILTYGPYAKGLAFQEGYPDQWRIMTEQHRDVAERTSNRYQSWEVVDPERWVPEGYVCVRVDSRGAGRSPGFLEPLSPRETRDFHDCIEWAGTRPWSNGKVGLLGISYYAINQWQVAGLAPPHLAAICPWEGSADWYRDMTRHGGILSTFWANWFDKQVKVVQNGLGERGARNPHTGEPVAGPETLDDDQLAANRADFGDAIRAHELESDYHRERSADWSRVEVPLLSAANWGGQGLHPRGNFEGFMRAASPQKWLEVHGLEHWTHFYTDYGVDLQMRFMGHFLKGEDTGWEDQPPVQLQVRHVDGSFSERHAQAWPPPDTEWTRLYLDLAGDRLSWEAPDAAATLEYEALGDGVTLQTAPLAEQVEILGPLAAKLFVSSSTADADLFCVLRVFDPGGEEVVFQGALDPHTPIAQGWLRASQRKLDPELSLPYRPYHSHDERQPLEPGAVYPVEVELWPTSIVVPAGYRIAFTVRGRDYEYAGEAASLTTFKDPMTGCGPFIHDDPRDRPVELFGGRQTLHGDSEHVPYVLLPVAPTR